MKRLTFLLAFTLIVVGCALPDDSRQRLLHVTATDVLLDGRRVAVPAIHASLTRNDAVRVRADRNAPQDKVVRVMEQCTAAGVTRITVDND